MIERNQISCCTVLIQSLGIVIHITTANTGVVEQYFEINNLLINPSKHTTSFSRQNIADRKVI
jgi:hypothetical protein